MANYYLDGIQPVSGSGYPAGYVPTGSYPTGQAAEAAASGSVDSLDLSAQGALGMQAMSSPLSSSGDNSQLIQQLTQQFQEALARGDYESADAIMLELRALMGQDAPSYTPDFGAVDYGIPLTPSYGSGDTSGAGYIDGAVQPFNGQTVSPLGSYRVSSEFGPRPSMGDNHKGIDLAAPSGTPIKAVADGTITRVANDPKGYGNWVEVKHSDGSVTRYAHMSAFGNVKVGQQVGAGSVLGAVGSTGRSTGPHLHFEWRDANGNAVNPRQKMNF